MTSCSSDYSPATPPPAHDFTGPGPEIYGEPDLGPWHAAYQDHRNLIGRRRRREITLVKKCHQIHIDSGCEVYLVISHRDDDRHVIYNSEPSQNWPPPPERLYNWYPAPDVNTPMRPGNTLRKGLGLTLIEDAVPPPTAAVSAASHVPPPPPMFRMNVPLSSLPPPSLDKDITPQPQDLIMFNPVEPLHAQSTFEEAIDPQLQSPITFNTPAPVHTRETVRSPVDSPTTADLSTPSPKRAVPLNFTIDIPSKRIRRDPRQTTAARMRTHSLYSGIHTQSLSTSTAAPSQPPPQAALASPHTPSPSSRKYISAPAADPSVFTPTGRRIAKRDRTGKFLRR